MKKSILVILAIGLILSFSTLAMAASSSTAGTGINNTHHDLSSHGTALGLYGDTADHSALNRICVYCHAPHNTFAADAGINTYRPLWNHEPTANVTFTMYDPGSEQPGNPSHMTQALSLTGMVPGSVSMLCLSCHDGTIATNAYGYASNAAPAKGTAPFVYVSARAVIGGAGGNDLSNHHPIGFSYDLAQANDVELRASGAAGFLKEPNFGTKPGGPAVISDLLWGANGNVECTSCHDVHNTQNGGDKFTWVQDQNSALCLTCHMKGVPNFL